MWLTDVAAYTNRPSDCSTSFVMSDSEGNSNCSRPFRHRSFRHRFPSSSTKYIRMSDFDSVRERIRALVYPRYGSGEKLASIPGSHRLVRRNRNGDHLRIHSISLYIPSCEAHSSSPSITTRSGTEAFTVAVRNVDS